VQFWEYLIITLVMLASVILHAWILRSMSQVSNAMRATVESFYKLLEQFPPPRESIQVAVDCPVCHQPIVAQPGEVTQIPHRECRSGRPRSWKNN